MVSRAVEILKFLVGVLALAAPVVGGVLADLGRRGPLGDAGEVFGRVELGRRRRRRRHELAPRKICKNRPRERERERLDTPRTAQHSTANQEI